MQTFPRGDTIFFSAVCRDQNGALINPSSATLNLTFKGSCGNPKTATIAMAVAGSTVTAQWESLVASPCQVNYSITAVGTNKITQDGSFGLTANSANPSS